ncbi:MAG: hypothetical protein EPO16_11140 [Dehalococcoidia bacterium]|nr:MAG: hypothetical protein EPO16_11140 [Dehalococcoidia bacterium]
MASQLRMNSHVHRIHAVSRRRNPVEIDMDVASSPLRRMVGMLGRGGLPRGAGLLIRPCNAVHTMGMRFPIDVVYLDREGFVVKIVPWLHPWRMSFGGRDAQCTLELVAGEAARLGIARGRLVRLPSAEVASRAGGWGAATVSALAGVGVAAGAIGLGWGTRGIDALALGAFFAALAVSSEIDLRERRIPNALTYPGIVAALGLAAATGAGVESLTGLLASGGLMSLCWLIGRGRLGLGDVKLAAFIGAALGARAVPTYLLIASGSGALAALGVLLVQRDRRATLAFGPWLALGAAAAALLRGLSLA